MSICLTLTIRADWAGDLPRLADIDNVLQDYATPSSLYTPAADSLVPHSSPAPHSHLETPTAAPLSNILSSTSLLNPFFGYPVAYHTDASAPNLRHGRRRKRDLVYTLARLWWQRWRNHVKVILLVLALVLASWRRRRVVKLWRRLTGAHTARLIR